MKFVFLLTGLTLAFTGFSQKLSNQIQFEKGKKLEMVIQVNMVVTQAMGDSKVNMNLTRIFDVNDVVNNTAVMEHKIKRVQFSMDNAMMGSQSFDSDKESDMKEDLGKAFEKGLKKKYTMTVDARGQVLSVKQEEENDKKKVSAEGDMMTGMMNQLSKGMDVPKKGDFTEFHILPDHEVAKGESWTDSLGGRTTVYTLTELTENEAIINFTEVEKIERVQEMMGREIQVKSTDKTTGRVILDRKTGLMKERSSSFESSGEMQMMGQTIPITRTGTKTITVHTL
jgi:hypothetical protein